MREKNKVFSEIRSDYGKEKSSERFFKIQAELPFSAKSFKEIGKENEELQKFVARLEAKFGDVIWYLGMDFFGEDIYERFLFKNGGFMEISLGTSCLEAFFDSKERAEKFKSAVLKSLESFSKFNEKKLKTKEGFIKFEYIFNRERGMT